MLKKCRKQKLQELESTFIKLVKEHSVSLCNSVRTKIKEVRRETDAINIEEVQKNLLLTKQRYYDTGGKALKLLS